MIKINGKEIEIIYLPDGTSQVKYPKNISHIEVEWVFENEVETWWIIQLAHTFGSKMLLNANWMPYARQDKGEFNSGLFFIDELLRNYEIQIRVWDIHNPDLLPLNAINIIETPDTSTFDLCLFPDKGAMDRYSQRVTIESKSCSKKRDSNGKVTIEVPWVASHNKILIWDDIIDGGATFIELAKKCNSKNLHLFVTHGIFSKGIDELLKYYKTITVKHIVGDYLSDEEKKKIQLLGGIKC